MTRIDDGNYDYHRAYSYRGNSGAMHYVYYLVYVPAGRSSSTNQYGYANYNEIIVRWNLSTRSRDCTSSRSPVDWIDKDNGHAYSLEASMCSGSHKWSWMKLASMGISNIYANDVAEPYTIETISVDISNSGGDGNYTMELLDGEVVLVRSSNKGLKGNSSARETVEFFMLDKDTELTISLTDNHTDEIVDEVIHTITIPTACTGVVCEPICFGNDLYETVCEDGICVQGGLLSADDTECGSVYDIPDYSEFVDFMNENRNDILALSIVGSIVAYKYLI